MYLRIADSIVAGHYIYNRREALTFDECIELDIANVTEYSFDKFNLQPCQRVLIQKNTYMYIRYCSSTIPFLS